MLLSTEFEVRDQRMSSSPPTALADRPTLPLILLLAGVYFVLGRLALVLALPQGFASSFWPAAGISLMALLLGGRRLWPGVALGSFLVNTSITFVSIGGLEVLRAAAVPAVIAVGAAMQALLGAWAVRRWVGFPRTLSQGRNIFLFFALGGPVSCLVSASVGVSALLVGGLVDPVEAAFSWWSWWVGDSIGVLVVVPPVLAFIDDRNGMLRRRRLRVGLPLLITTAAVVTVFAFARAQERRQLELELGQQALSLAHTFEKHIERTVEDLMSIEGLYAAAEHVTRQEFRQFAQRILERNPTFQALSWNPRVLQRERPAYEAAGRADGFPDYGFTEAGAGGLQPAAERSEYVVVHYIEPYPGNEAALGFDIASNPSRREAVERARDKGSPVATAGIHLVQETGEQTGVLILMPVYAGGARGATLAERQRDLRGYATGVLRVGDALMAALADLPWHGFAVTLVDHSAPEEDRVLVELSHDAGQAGAAELSWRFDQDVGGRVWSLRLTPTAGLLAGYRRWYAWLVLACGLGLVSLLGALLLVQSGRAAELAAFNAQLQEGLERRRRLEGQREKLIGELELRNAELERFSYTVSHDLKSPLITIKGYLGLLEKDLAAGRTTEVETEIGRLHGAADRMREMVDDLLDLSRAGHATGPAQVLSLGDVVREAVAHVGGRVADGVRIQVASDLPRVEANRGQLLEVLQNLLDNAIKFRGADDPWVEIGATVQGNRVVCHVRDNGTGIDPAHHGRIFGLFTRLDQTREGTGIGLALVRRIVEASGGSVWVESAGKGHGSTFYFTLNAA